MNILLSWLRDYVEIDLSPLALARKLTMIGLEVEEIRLVGLPSVDDNAHDFKVVGLPWNPQQIVVAQIDEVMPHPNADRLTLCRLHDGLQEQIVLTGAPNLFEYKGKGPLEKPLKVAYAKEGAQIYDGHQPGQVLTTLKRAKIRGVDSYSMVCSEKELGISEEHDGIILLDDDAPTGMALADYMGDVVFEVNILPNMIRNASMLGVARELAAVTGKALRAPDLVYPVAGESVDGQAQIEIREPELNPRFVLGLIRDVTIAPSPYAIQRRLRLAGMRPINNIVDATNYVMLATGQPLHAFDYDVLVQRAGGETPTIITRRAAAGETLVTLDEETHTLNDFTVLVCDTAGSLSIAGVMGGLESEVFPTTRNVLLEGANWNYINVRRTMAAQKMTSEAGYRFSRGVHPSLAPLGVQLGLKQMQAWGGGNIAPGLIDAYPLPYQDPSVTVTERDVLRMLGIELSANDIARLLSPLGFDCQVSKDTVIAKSPATRVDIGEGVIGLADVMEEIARMFGYDNIPATSLRDVLPPQNGNPVLEQEERLRDVLVNLGMQEVVNYRLTTPEREARLYPNGNVPQPLPYVRLRNPMTSDRAVMRRSVLAALMETIEHNVRLRPRLAMFEIGPVFEPDAEASASLPAEPHRLALALTGQRQLDSWDLQARGNLDFFDLKGIIEGMAHALHLPALRFEPMRDAPGYHPGKCAVIYANETRLGVMGELHPRVKENYDLLNAPVQAAEFDLAALLSVIPPYFKTESVPTQPPVLEDIAVIVDEATPAAEVEAVIRQGGGKMLVDVRLFDIFRGEQVGEGKKSLAYSLTYQSADKTLNDTDAGQVRKRIIRRLEQVLGAKLRS